jgi:AcrR family transcriptional regulator
MMQSYHHGSLPIALLQAAEIILERDGIGALTLRATAREAGVSHAAPAHHFGDLSGLFSELAATGFVRLREYAEIQATNVRPGSGSLLVAHSRGYVEFARAHPGLFQLMFRSERLNWGNPALATAGAAAFALLTLPEAELNDTAIQDHFQGLVAAAARWSFAHGLAMLLIDGRLEAMTYEVPGATVDALIDALLKRLIRLDSQNC